MTDEDCRHLEIKTLLSLFLSPYLELLGV